MGDWQPPFRQEQRMTDTAQAQISVSQAKVDQAKAALVFAQQQALEQARAQVAAAQASIENIDQQIKVQHRKA
jgi:hypothetical protein